MFRHNIQFSDPKGSWKCNFYFFNYYFAVRDSFLGTVPFLFKQMLDPPLIKNLLLDYLFSWRKGMHGVQQVIIYAQQVYIPAAYHCLWRWWGRPNHRRNRDLLQPLNKEGSSLAILSNRYPHQHITHVYHQKHIFITQITNIAGTTISSMN